MKHLLPEGWPRPSGYSNGIAAEGTPVFTAGMIGWNEKGEFADGFAAQLAQTLKNTLAVLAQAGAGPHDIVRMTWYVVDLEDYRNNLAAVGKVYRELMGRNFPCMTVVGVTGLVEQDALLEIESTAVISSTRNGAP